MTLIIENLKKMMINRGYSEISSNPLVFSNDKEKIFCQYPNIRKINGETFKKILFDLEELKIDRAVIVFNQGLTTGVSVPPNKDIQFLSFKDLTIDKIEHSLVPKHSLVEQKDLKYKIEDLPLISANDAICRYYSFKKGDVIKVESKDEKLIEYKKVV